MKRVILAFVAVLALFASVQTVKADWVVEVNSNGWAVLRWDPAFDDGSFFPPPPPPSTFPLSLRTNVTLVFLGKNWYLLVGDFL